MIDALASADTLMRQAPMTVDFYLHEAIKGIDAVFGDGYAAKNPQLVGVFIQACAQDFHTSLLKAGLQDLRDAVESVATAIDGHDLTV